MFNCNFSKKKRRVLFLEILMKDPSILIFCSEFSLCHSPQKGKFLPWGWEVVFWCNLAILILAIIPVQTKNSKFFDIFDHFSSLKLENPWILTTLWPTSKISKSTNIPLRNVFFLTKLYYIYSFIQACFCCFLQYRPQKQTILFFLLSLLYRILDLKVQIKIYFLTF